ncbi:MAG: Urmylation protein [Bathelium mastoideum]|nr:MAG: Urmylation protein [Bathelium mastoideum]
MYSTAHLDNTVAHLRNQIATHEAQLCSLREQLAEAERRAHNVQELITEHDLEQAVRGGFMPEWQQETWDVLGQHGNGAADGGHEGLVNTVEREEERKRWALELEEYRRYGRQLILPEIGLQGQLRLKGSAVCIVGAGGLGCPAAAYLAGAGVGTIGLVDGDTVEVSNLHRQVLHNTGKVGMLKVESVANYISALNPNIKIATHPSHLSPSTALDTLRSYSLILDCTDNPQSRYLISDACVLLGKPLVSASALRTDGQLMVLNNPPRSRGDSSGGPCYRCVFPRPPPPESVISCGEGGILGPVVGVMGVLQALEAIKLIAAGIPGPTINGNVPAPLSVLNMETVVDNDTNKDHVIDQDPPQPPAEPPTLLLFSATASPPFRSIRLRPRRPTCAACSVHASITHASLDSGSLDYAQFCGTLAQVEVLRPEERISAAEYMRLLQKQEQERGDEQRELKAEPRRAHVLVDVRESTQFALCQLPGSVNVPFSELVSPQGLPVNGNGNWKKVAGLDDFEAGKDVVVVCRYGNDSQLAVQKMKKMGLGEGRSVVDIKGGLRAWREEVDGEFPDY